MHTAALRAAVNLLRQGEVVHAPPQNLYKDDFKRFPSITVVTPAEIS